MERMEKRTDFYDCIDKIQRQDKYIEHIEEENRKLKEMSGKLGEMNGKLGEWVNNLEQENKKLKEDNRFLTKISKEYMEKENIIQVTEFTELYKDDLEKENERLREKIKHLEFDVDARYQLKLLLEGEIEKLRKENEELKEYKSMYEGLC